MLVHNLVCSPELSKRLHELGVTRESYFYYLLDKRDNKLYIETKVPYFTYNRSDGSYLIAHLEDLNCFEIYPAYTCSELSEIIFQLNNDNLEQTGYLEITTEMVYRSGGDFYRLTNNLLKEHIIDNLNLANCYAILLAHLLENGLIKND